MQNPSTNGTGQIVTGSYRSLTDALQKNQQHLAVANKALQSVYALFDAVPFAVAALKGPELIIDYINQYNLDIWQCRKEDVLGKPLFEARPDVRSSAEGIHKELYRTGRRFDAKEIPFLFTENGKTETRYFDAVIDPITDEQGTIIGQLATSTDVTEKVLAQKKVEESEKRFRATFDNAAVGMAHVGLDGSWLLANNRLCQIVGYTKEEFLSSTFQHITHPDDLNADLSLLHQVLAGKIDTYTMEKRYFHKKGHIVWVNLTVSLVKKEDGAPAYFISVVEDISERRKAERQVLESERRFRLMADAIPEVIWVTDAEGKTEFMNKRWEAYCGVPFEPSTAAEVSVVFLHPHDAPAVMAAFGEALRTGKPMEVEQRNRSASGAYRWFLNRAMPYRDPQTGEILKWFGIGIDIHDRKMAQQALFESEQRFRTMSEHSPTWVWMTDEKVNVSYANKEMLAYLGLPHYNEFSGHVWERLTHPDDIQSVYAAFGDAVQKQEPFAFESRVKNAATGAFEWCLFKGAPHFEERTFVGFIGTGLHIHQQKTMMENLEHLVAERTRELAQANKELQRSNEDLQQFAHVASHDLKEPVRKVMTFSNLLKQELKMSLSERANTYLSKIESSAIRMYSMIDGVLLYSSLNALEQTKELVDLNELVQSIEGDLEVPVLAKGAQIKHKNLPSITGSSILLYQLFYNLINNSLKFSKPDVPPVITINEETVSVNERMQNNPDSATGYVKIVLRDNGIGFSDMEGEKIFGTFTRLHAKDKYEGTGLGLALCKKIVERHSGAIRAEGKEGDGATFHMLLPK